MNLLLGNSTDFWVPTFLLNDYSNIVWSNLPLFLLMSLLIALSGWLVVYAMIVVYTVRRVHENATWLIVSLLAGWFEGILGVILIFPYKYGIVSLGDPSKVFYGFESKSLLSLELSWRCAPLLLGSILVWHYLGLLISGIFCLVVERTLATLYFCDYETTPRKWITYSLIFYYHASAIVISLFFCFHVLSLSTLLICNVLGFAVSFPYIFLLRYYNITARNRMRLAQNITKHSLTAKFQTEENVRSMNIAARIAIVCSSFDALFLLVIILATTDAPGAALFFQATECVLFLNPLFLVPGVVSSVADWRNRFLQYMPINRFRIDPDHNPYVQNDQRHAEIHFLQLQNLWI